MTQYTGHNLTPAHDLHHSWTGWPSSGSLPPLPAPPLLDALASAWHGDGLELESHAWTAADAHLTFRAGPDIAPVLVAQRAKGRLQHALRKAGTPVDFSRKVSVRSLGHNITPTVERYVREQLEHADLADPRCRATLAAAAVADASVDLAVPSETNSGRYWYNLHVVLVVAKRFRIGGADFLGRVREQALRAAAACECRVKALAIMPDHLHAALRGDVARSPAEIAIALQNATTHAAGCRMWQDGFYVGTFGEYDLGAVR